MLHGWISQEENNEKTNDVFIALEDLGGKIYTCQTGCLPRTSNKGMKGLTIAYIYNVNTIIGFSIKHRSEEELLRVYR